MTNQEFERRQKAAIHRHNALLKNRCPDCGDSIRHQPSENGGTLLFCNNPACAFEAINAGAGLQFVDSQPLRSRNSTAVNQH